MPWYLQVAIEAALTILSWHENLPRNEIPPRFLWDDPQGLEMWWNDIEDKRKSGVDTSSRWSPSESSDSDDDGDQPPQQAENDLARMLKAQR